MIYFENPEKLMGLMTQLWNGLGNTLTLFFMTLLFSLPLGMAVALLRMSKYKAVRAPVSLYILIMRGTPLILQIFTIYFIIPMILGHAFDRMSAVIIAFVLNYAAYFAEIYRGGILSVPDGQREAGKVLGMTKAQTFLRVLLPQVTKNIILPISNEVITLVKDTALVTGIGVLEMYSAAKKAANASGSLVPLFLAGAVYLLLNTAVTVFFNRVMKKFNYYQA